MLVKAGGESLLIDAGVSARTLSAALHRRGVGAGNVSAILLTHEHDDHMRGAAQIATRLNAPVVANRSTLAAANRREELPATLELATGAEMQIGSLTVRSFSVSHDAVDPVGYVIRAGGHSVFYATDLGCATATVYDAMKGASLCILESNHDEEWLRRGPYPTFMKVRVASNTGHLSNEAAAGLISRKLEEDGPASIWLAHLSAVNNSPAFAHKYVSESVSASTKTVHKLEVALRGRPSAMWRAGQIAVQKTLF